LRASRPALRAPPALITTSARTARSACPLTVDGASVTDLITFDVTSLSASSPARRPDVSFPRSREFPMPDDDARKHGLPAIDWTRIAAELAPVEVLDDPVTVKKRSRDFFWYSPILNAELRRSFGDLVARPKRGRNWPIASPSPTPMTSPVTLRGGGTGQLRAGRAASGRADRRDHGDEPHPRDRRGLRAGRGRAR
jgi:hypothetical protein